LPVPVPSKLESAAQHLNKRNKVESSGIAYAQGSTNFPGKFIFSFLFLFVFDYAFISML
jgi:hypothetical protein